MSGDITRLPKWAQARIRTLEGEVRDARERLRLIEAPPRKRKDTGTLAAPDSEAPVVLPEDVTIRFRIGLDGIDVQKKPHNGKLGLEVRARGISKGLAIKPHASNVILIYEADA